MIIVFITVGGLNVEGENDSWDFGTGAGFYVDAIKPPYDKGYNMYSYVTEELPKTVFAAFKELDSGRVSITGHSMGGHGALTLVFPFPQKYDLLISGSIVLTRKSLLSRG